MPIATYWEVNRDNQTFVLPDEIGQYYLSDSLGGKKKERKKKEVKSESNQVSGSEVSNTMATSHMGISGS